MMNRSHPSGRPVPRSRSGIIGRHFERTGTEPATAQSAVGLRIILVVAALALFALAAAALGLWAGSASPEASPGQTELTGMAIACGVLCLIAVLNLVFLLRRRARERPPRHGRS
ncbi:DUF6343 family protein [Streptomyces globosus]|uniref:DUF6343 family protein n=1 Tax=Streptomyces globosus TaxID=68209 RepID=UPI0013B380BC|nr:DUF6343 family protein [Streptomyces globosus]